MQTKFYVMHYKKNTKRRERLMPILNKMDIDAQWYTEYDKEELNEEILNKYYNPDINIFRERTAGLKTEAEYQQYNGVSKGHVSLCIKYIKCMEDLVNSNYDNAVFLEDDVTFNSICNKETILNALAIGEEAGWDSIFLGGAFQHQLIADRILAQYKNLLLVGHPATNTTSSFALTRNACQKILGTFDIICNSIDWEFNYHLKVNNLKVWHIFPYLFGQLSTSGHEEYTCTL